MQSADIRKEIDLMEYWSLILRRKWIAITFAGTLIFLTGVFSFLATPKYKSTATLLIEEVTCPPNIGPGVILKFSWTKGVGDGQEALFSGADHHHAPRGRGAAQSGDSGC